MITCTRRVQFCAGHRLMGHESKCAHLHGHNYVALFEAEAAGLDDVGRVIDFAVLKDRLGGFVEDHWDHGFLYHHDDRATEDVLVAASDSLERGQKMYALPYNPTAENIARYLGEVVAPCELVDAGVRVVRVTVWETENCCATWEVGDGDRG